jgi:AraC family transcriptional activator of pobA
MQAAPFPRFFLYGEPPRAAGDQFLHIEELEERSRAHAWTIRPHAHADLHQMFYLRGGRGLLQIEDRNLAFEAPCALLVPAGFVHGLSYEAGAQGTVMTFTDGLLRDVAGREGELLGLFGHGGCMPLCETRRIDFVVAELSRELCWSAPGRRTVIQGLMKVVLADLMRHTRQAENPDAFVTSGHPQLVACFRALIETHYREQPHIAFYADRLGVTPPRLRQACMGVTGAAPSVLLADRLLLEAKRALTYSDATVAEIGYSLGFSDPAYFSRFFTKRAGSSPSRFRRQQQL